MSYKILAVLVTATLSMGAHAGQTTTKRFDFGQEIVGGTPAVKGELPFQVSLQSSSGSHFCGGSLIKKNWVLTASHCVQGSSSMKIVVGLHDQKDLKGTETFTAKKIVAHPQFNSSTLDYDYALIQLSGDSKFRTIDLNRIEMNISDDPSKASNVWTSGWGTTSQGSFQLPNILNKVEVPLVTAALCNAPASYNGQITDRMICAGLVQGGKDSCQGDSGGPLFVRQTSGDFLLVGVVSWGEGCAKPNKFGVYSKVNAMVDWIDKESQ